jgi:ribonucleoside-diphosphate reductase alpha chain
MTVYRDGSRLVQAQTGLDSNRQEANRDIAEEGVTYKKKLTCGNMYVTINHNENNDINEVFATIGKGGSCNYSFMESINRLVSVSLQNKVPLLKIIKQLKGIRCSSVSIPQKGGAYLSCSDAIARTLIERYEALTHKKVDIDEDDKTIVQLCPECGSPVLYEIGCKRCVNTSCGWKAC